MSIERLKIHVSAGSHINKRGAGDLCNPVVVVCTKTPSLIPSIKKIDTRSSCLYPLPHPPAPYMSAGGRNLVLMIERQLSHLPSPKLISNHILFNTIYNNIIILTCKESKSYIVLTAHLTSNSARFWSHTARYTPRQPGCNTLHYYWSHNLIQKEIWTFCNSSKNEMN